MQTTNKVIKNSYVLILIVKTIYMPHTNKQQINSIDITQDMAKF